MPALLSERGRLLALDTETSGVDIHHGAVPYFVTVCDQDGHQEWWETDVDPITRKVQWSREDQAEILFALKGAEEIALHNSKFDAKALVESGVIERWDWGGVHDTLIAAHLLGSNQKKDLTSLALNWLGIDIQPYEDRLEKVVKEARNYVRSQQTKGKLQGWRIVKKGDEDNPSAKDRHWKHDCWLPLALRRLENHGTKEWDTVLRDYANADSDATMRLWKVFKAEITRLDLWSHYHAKMAILPVLMDMEKRGVTINRRELETLRHKYLGEYERQGKVMVNIATSLGAELELPKGGRNGSLDRFCFDVLKLPPVRNPKAKTERPSLDSKNAIPHYLDTLPPKSKALRFIQGLEQRRSYGTAAGYLDAYNRFMLQVQPWYDEEAEFWDDWFLLHPNINPTGTDTMRRSHSNPNSANVGKQAKVNLRSCFGPAPGREWWSFDAQNLELRIPAYECGEKELIDLFERSDEPPYYGSEHLLNFSTVYPDIWEAELKAVGFNKVGPHVKEKYKSTYYQRCKNGGFAIGYGAIDRPDGYGTADKTFGRPGSHARLKARFAKKEALNQYWIRFAEKHGYVETMPVNGARHGYPLLCSRTTWGGIKPTVPLNYHVQGTAGEWMGRGMVRVHQQLVEWRSQDFDAWICLEVHDELVVDMPKGEDPTKRGGNYQRAAKITALLEQSGKDIDVPTPVSMEWHPVSWDKGTDCTKLRSKKGTECLV